MNNVNGWINLYKPKNISSGKCINVLKKIMKLNKLGHCGTLDPLAEGILPIAIGKTTKLIKFINKNKKKYIFTINWKKQTSTDDSEGYVIKESSYVPKKKEIEEKLNYFIGEIKQIPPNASAVKVNGERAYKLFRKNINFSLNSKLVSVYNIKLLDTDLLKSTFEIECGSGFYVRSFARDFAISLGTYGYISSLKRVKVGKFNIKNSILLDDLIKIGQRQTKFKFVQSSISMLDDILALEIEKDNDIQNLSNGKTITLEKDRLYSLNLNSVDKKNFFLSNKGEVISYGEIDGYQFKPKKVLI
tara:strand:- start:470 stop:1375 length:906 start_codon:yes stop_codon:yes gene_type:complete